MPLGNVIDQSVRRILSSGRARDILKAFRENADQFSFCRECENLDMKGHTANVKTIVLTRDYLNSWKR